MAERRRSPRKPSRPRLQDTVRLSAEGLAKVLCDLEARVLRSVWTLGLPVPARAVYELVAKEHRVALLTVVTVLNKLVAKGILSRQKRGDLLHYEARQSEAEFTAMASRRIVEGILSLSSEAVTASFVDVLAEQDPEQFERLARMVRQRRAKDEREKAE